MKPGDSINVYEFKLNRMGDINLVRKYICTLELVGETPDGEEWSAVGTADDGSIRRHFKSYEMGRRYEGDIMYLPENSPNLAREAFVKHYEHAILFYERKRIEASKWVDRIKRGTIGGNENG